MKYKAFVKEVDVQIIDTEEVALTMILKVEEAMGVDLYFGLSQIKSILDFFKVRKVSELKDMHCEIEEENFLVKKIIRFDDVLVINV